MWKRIDNIHELKKPRRAPGVRVFGKHGQLWPRLSLRVHVDVVDEETIRIRLMRKPEPHTWWEEVPTIPLDLQRDLVEMLSGEIPRWTPGDDDD